MRSPEGVLCACGRYMRDETGFAEWVRFRSGTGDGKKPAFFDSHTGADLKRFLADLFFASLLGAVITGALTAVLRLTDGGGEPNRFGVSLFGMLVFWGAAFVASSTLLIGQWRKTRRKLAPMSKQRKQELAHIERIRKRPRVRIAQLSGGDERAVGRIRVVEAPEGQDSTVALNLADGRQTGRFMVEDESGVAYVDDDMVELFLEQSGQRVLDENAWVEISGPGKREAVAGGRRGYRGGEEAYVFDGTPEEKVEIVRLGREPSKAEG